MAKIDDIRAFDGEELVEELEESQKEIMNLRFRAATMQLTNVNEIVSVRKKIARIMTVIKEREMLGNN